MFPKIGVFQNGWLIMENPIKMDDLGGPPLSLETPIFAVCHHQPPRCANDHQRQTLYFISPPQTTITIAHRVKINQLIYIYIISIDFNLLTNIKLKIKIYFSFLFNNIIFLIFYIIKYLFTKYIKINNILLFLTNRTNF